jgi:hypothetical protein
MSDPLTGSYHESKHFDLRRCPAGQIGPEWNAVVDCWAVFGGRDTFGPLPVAGGWLDQTQWFADAHAALSSERSRYHEKLEREAEAKRKQPTGRRR